MGEAGLNQWVTLALPQVPYQKGQNIRQINKCYFFSDCLKLFVVHNIYTNLTSHSVCLCELCYNQTVLDRASYTYSDLLLLLPLLLYYFVCLCLLLFKFLVKCTFVFVDCR